MLIAMADESGANQNSNFFSMAAYVADHQHWIQFSEEWNTALEKHGIPYFHMWEFAGSRETFRGWTEDRRRALMLDLLRAIMARPMWAVGATMRLADFTRLTEDDKKQYIGPYMMCFYELVYGLSLNADYGFPSMGVDFVYSEQNQFSKMMRRWWKRAKSEKSYGPKLGVLEFQNMRKVPGLQAADLLAWEFRHFYHLRDTRPDLEMRFPMQCLGEHQKWSHAQTLKYLPGWYIEFQVKQVHSAAMKVIFDDPERWWSLLESMDGPGMDPRASLKLFGILEKYAEYRGEKPLRFKHLWDPPPQMAGGLRLTFK